MVAENTVEIRVGRLLEVRADAGYRTREEVDSLFDRLEVEVRRLGPKLKHVTVVDWRNCPLMAPEAAARIGERIAAANARTERSAAIAQADAHTSVLQFVRVIRDAGLPDRKLFFEEQSLMEFLWEVLIPSERQRLRAFLSRSDQ